MYQRLFELQETIFKVIANQKRLEIIQLLKDRELSVSEMVEMLGIRQANLSQHLALLRQHRIVTTRKKGQNVFYHLTDPKIADSTKLIRRFLSEQHTIDPDVRRIMKRSGRNLYPIVKDPVCGMRLSASEAAASVRYRGTLYHFCASGCRQKFSRQPSRYAGTRRKS